MVKSRTSSWVVATHFVEASIAICLNADRITTIAVAAGHQMEHFGFQHIHVYLHFVVVHLEVRFDCFIGLAVVFFVNLGYHKEYRVLASDEVLLALHLPDQ